MSKVEILAELPRLTTEELAEIQSKFLRPDARGLIAVGERPCPFQRRFGRAADDNWERGALHRHRPKEVVAQVVEFAVERFGGTGPEMAPQADSLVEVCAAPVESIRGSKISELSFDPAQPDAGDHSASAQHVESGQFLGEQHGISLTLEDIDQILDHCIDIARVRRAQ